MQPFKPYFLGREKPPAPRLADVQKCFRTTDIEEVGNTARHLTFFEMLGNWSFGDYFKEESIPWGWELSTEGFGMDPERIWVTVFGGDEELGLGPDEEAIEIWRGVGVPDERIVRLGREDNFWQAGPTGPCGPCSELYLDRGAEFGADDERPGDDTDRFLEFWNHVFMSYDLAEDGTLTELPMRNIDTGMGLDRMAAILQDVPSVYETDHVRPLIDLAEELSGHGYEEGDAVTRAMRIVADHSRGAAFLIADGVVPSNEDRGYILRRIMRRAIQQGNTLGLEAPWLGRFAERTIELMGDAYPELVAERETIARWVDDEEESFGRTLERGTELLERLIAEAKESGDLLDRRRRRLQAARHLRLPLRPDQGAAGRGGARGRRRRLRGADGGAAHRAPAPAPPPRTAPRTRHERVDRLRRGGAADPLRRLRDPARDHRPRRGRRATTAAPWSSSRRAPSTPRAAARSPTPGVLRWARRGGEGRRRLPGRRRPGARRSSRAAPRSSRGVAVEAMVDRETRHATMRNHTATHLLHAALRERLGTHVRQAGSAVRPDKLRFDFTHGQALEPEELRDVEDRVNEWVKASRPVRWLNMERAEAEKLGAMALFGEKYGEWVRVVEVDGVSRELCGGTHVANTAEVGIFKIASEGSSAANVRRIEAITGPAAIDWFREREAQLREAGELLGNAPGPAGRRPPRRRAAARGRRRAPSRPQPRQLGDGGGRAGRGGRRPAVADGAGGSSWSQAKSASATDRKQLLDLANRVQSKLGGEAVVVALGGDFGEQGRPGRAGLRRTRSRAGSRRAR